MLASPRGSAELKRAVLRRYQIILADECIAVRDANTPQMALIDYLRISGCRNEDIVRLGTQSVAWRGAVYRAVPERASDATRTAD